MNNKWIWYWHRLHAMSVPEVWHRTVQHIDRQKERRKVTQNPQTIEDGLNFVTNICPLPFVWNSEMQLIHETRFANHSLIQSQVDKLLGHQFELLGFGKFSFGKHVPWHVAIPSMKLWECTYWNDIPLQGRDELGEIRATWELNRHHHFVTLAKAYLVTQDNRCLRELEEQLSSWFSQNPIGIGVNFASKMELAIRVINWMTCNCFLQLASEESTRGIRRMLQGAVLQHCRSIIKDLSLYSSANNHLVVECVSLAITSLLFPNWRESAAWLRHSINILKAHVPQQVAPDGVHREQATHYQIFVMEALLLLTLIARKTEFQLPHEITDGLRQMCIYIRTLINHAGKLPTIGDSDDGHILDLGTTHYNHTISILQVCAVLFQDVHLLTPDNLEEYAFWLLDPTEIRNFEAMSSTIHDPQSKIFAHGGMTIFRCNHPGIESIMTFNHGDLGYGALAAHGHADALSITLSICGQPTFVDPGSYIYNIEQECRSYFRSTLAHNTICLDNRNQSEILGPFLWGNRAKAQVQDARFGNIERVIASHDGYKPSEHIRTISFQKPDIWFVEDTINVAREQSLVCSWHVAPEIPVCIEGRRISLCLQYGCLYGWVIAPDGLSILLESGWYASVFGRKETIPVIRIAGTCPAQGYRILTVWSYNKVLSHEQIQSLHNRN